MKKILMLGICVILTVGSVTACGETEDRSYRGTNYPDHEEGRYDDITQGSTLGAGFYTVDQGIMAIGSYGRIVA